MVLITNCNSEWHLPEEYVIDLFSNEGSQAKKFAINSVQDGLQKISLSRILTVK